MKFDFSQVSDAELLSRLLALRGKERKIELEIIRHLSEVEDRGLHLKRGHSSLFIYCTQALGYAEGSAYRRTEAMKLVRSVPEAGRALQEGALSVTSASQAQVFFAKTILQLDLTAKEAVLKKLEGQSTRQCERILAELDPAAVVQPQEKIRALSGNRAALTVILSAELQGKLESFSLFSHQVQGRAELIEKLADMALEKLDPEKRMETERLKTEKTHRVTFARKLRKPHSETRYIEARLRRSVFVQGQGRCQYRCPTTGRLCHSTRYLQVDHIRKFSEGGSAVLENLRLLCGAHNRAR